MNARTDSRVQLICPACRQPIVRTGDDWACPGCRRPFTRNQGILSFLTPEERFNEGAYEEKQIAAWTYSARLRDKIRASAALSLLNAIRIRFSLSGRRDRLFLKEMKPGASPDRLILDLGCGGGRHYLCDYGTVIGIDPVLPLLQMAKTIYAEVYQTSGMKLPFADNTFDYVVSSDVLGHITAPHKDQLFSEIFRVLKPGGRTAHCSEADADNVWYNFARRDPVLWQKYFVDLPGHVGLESPTRLRQRFLAHGFTEITFKRLNSFFQEPGTLVALFDNEYRRKSRLLSAAVALDHLLNRNFLLRELVNFLLEPLAQIEDAVTGIDHTSGALVVYEKPSRG